MSDQARPQQATSAQTAAVAVAADKDAKPGTTPSSSGSTGGASSAGRPAAGGPGVGAPGAQTGAQRASGGRTGARGDKRSLFQLIGDIPTLVTDLVKGEIEQLKSEMIVKLKALGIGGGIIAVAVVILAYMVGVLLTAAVLGLAEVMPAWLAALVVAAFLLIVAAIVGFIGYRKLKGGIPPVPEKTIKSVKRDIDTIKGMAK